MNWNCVGWAWVRVRARGAVGLVGLGAALLAAGCHERPEPVAAEAWTPVEVDVAPVEAKLRVATEEVLGTVRAKRRATIAAKVSGRILKMPVVAGQAVAAGELLVQLDAQEVQARLEQARATLEQAEGDMRRFETLLKESAVTQQEYDAVAARYRVAKASVTEAETLLSYTRIEAPFAGVVSRKLADEGDLSSPGRPLVELEDPENLQFEADISEALIGRIQMGTKLRVRVGAVTNVVEGVVSEIAPAADPNTRTFRVKLDLPAAENLRLGQFGRVAVPVLETTAPRVPASAVVVRGQLEMVFVVTNQIARLRLVKTGKPLGGEVEILAGVSRGETVVVAGAGALRDGQPVEVK